ncbi:MAG: histone deacetylase family protein [Acidimicrobiales bacterium]
MILLVSGPVGAESHVSPDHPEHPDRIGAVTAAITDLRLGSEVRWAPERAARPDELARAHDPAYLSRLEEFCQRGGGQLDPDTFAVTDSWSAARNAAGAGLAAVDALRGQAHPGRATTGHGIDDAFAFVVARPPGHHAERGRAMGFCLVNNVAVAAAALADTGERVLVVDWDVHHGNGTQAIFWDDRRVLYVSTHQWPLYPGTGAASETGGPSAPGLTVNIPLPAGATGDVVRRAIEEVAGPTIEGFAPTWVLVSAGFDAHQADPLAGLALSAGDFADLARLVASMVPGPGRLALFLEGGYRLDALRSSVRATLAALLGESARRTGGGDDGEAPTTGGPGADMVAVAGRERARALA